MNIVEQIILARDKKRREGHVPEFIVFTNGQKALYDECVKELFHQPEIPESFLKRCYGLKILVDDKGLLMPFAKRGLMGDEVIWLEEDLGGENVLTPTGEIQQRVANIIFNSLKNPENNMPLRLNFVSELADEITKFIITELEGTLPTPEEPTNKPLPKVQNIEITRHTSLPANTTYWDIEISYSGGKPGDLPHFYHGLISLDNIIKVIRDIFLRY